MRTYLTLSLEVRRDRHFHSGAGRFTEEDCVWIAFAVSVWLLSRSFLVSVMIEGF